MFKLKENPQNFVNGLTSENIIFFRQRISLKSEDLVPFKGSPRLNRKRTSTPINNPTQEENRRDNVLQRDFEDLFHDVSAIRGNFYVYV